jgi:phenol 2-monooxygenase (NADPH)
VNEYLEVVYSANAQFTVGLGISYGPNAVNVAASSSSTSPIPGIKIGSRCPDAPLFRPAFNLPQALRTHLRYKGRFWVLIFAGKLQLLLGAMRLNPESTKHYREIRSYIDSDSSFSRNLLDAFNFLTILHGDGSLQSAETLGVQPIGRTLFDKYGEAYAKFGMNDDAGGIVVIRPDGIVSFVAPLDDCHQLGSYFGKIINPRATLADSAEHIVSSSSTVIGREISIEGADELIQTKL